MATENLGQIGVFFKGTTPPTNTDLVWLDNSVSPAVFMVYDNTQSMWVTQVAGAGGGDVTAASTFETNNALIRADGTGKGVQSSGVLLNDSDIISGLSGITGDGADLQLNGGTDAGTGEGSVIILYDKDAGGGNADLLKLFAGSTGSGSIQFLTGGSGTPKASIDSNGNWDFNGNQINNFAQKAGEVYFSTPIETVIATVNTPVKALGTTTSGTLDLFDTNSVSNRLRYLGTDTEDFLVVASASITTASNNKVIGIYIAKNGVVEAGSEIIGLVSTGADVGSISTNILVSLAQNDYIELWVENQTDSTNMTIEKCSLSIK